MSMKAAQTWHSTRGRSVSNPGCHTEKHHHLGSANTSAGFLKSWIGLQSKYTVVCRKGEGVWVASSSSCVGSCQTLVGNSPLPWVCFESQVDCDKAGFSYTLISVLSRLLGQMPVAGQWQ